VGGAVHPLNALRRGGDGQWDPRVVFVDVGGREPDNRAIVEVVPGQAQTVVGMTSRYVARVVNHGTDRTPEGNLQVYVGDAVQPPLPLPAIGPGETVDVEFELTLVQEGSQDVTVELPADGLRVDDRRLAVLPVIRAMQILIVNGEAAADPYQDEVYLLATALRPEGPQFSGNEVTIIEEQDLAGTDLSTFHLVILANVFQLTDDAAGRLEEYAANGGGLAVFLGDQVDAGWYNRLLYRQGAGLLPAALAEVRTAPADTAGASVGGPAANHPVMQRFAGEDAAFFSGIRVRRWLQCVPEGEGETSALATRPGENQAEATGDADERGPARVLLRVENADRDPLILERAFGKGRVWLITTSADKEWTNWPERPTYVVLMLEMAQHLARPATGGDEVLVGETIGLVLDPARHQPTATLKTPAYPDEPAIRLDAQPDPTTGLPQLEWARTDLPGIYQFELVETSGLVTRRHVAVNVDPSESDLRRVDRTTLMASAGGIEVTYVEGAQLADGTQTESRYELWPALLVALVVVLMGEQTLAWWFGGGR
jgi:hypothetical protein